MWLETGMLTGSDLWRDSQGKATRMNWIFFHPNWTRGYTGPHNFATKCNDGYKSKDPRCQAFFFQEQHVLQEYSLRTRPLDLPCLSNKVVIVNSWRSITLLLGFGQLRKRQYQFSDVIFPSSLFLNPLQKKSSLAFFQADQSPLGGFLEVPSHLLQIESQAASSDFQPGGSAVLKFCFST